MRGIRELQVTFLPNSRRLQSKGKPVPKVLRRQGTLRVNSTLDPLGLHEGREFSLSQIIGYNDRL